ncbi:hypothetical protein [Plebeiibacterium marinum]|uniref:Uncharacterized protein n=1 Tax=Plebeiibacterium marinum TaxID=2992111 RepID=A0AAE3MEF0_9BACT|nr:hypothetical protein [Plebeiobacterium marinum]MCW3806085.1 hypothetical protein [Plebeiobacterium marinum]
MEKNQTVHRILLFIKNTLPEFETIFKNSNVNFRLEDDISKELLRFFNDKSRSKNLLFQFNEKKGVDFTVFLAHPFIMGASSIFMIEAKRLSKKHYDYVSGGTGGIERIKREQEQFGKHLNQGAMIGYIQDYNASYWNTRINSWISDLIAKDTDIEWNEQDKLIPNTELSDFTSIHKRITKNDICLYHFWIDLN